MCVAQRGVRCLSVIRSSCEELRCLFVREGWDEHFLWLWHTSCSRMHTLWDTHRWDWACLSIIYSEWESLSRMMWRGRLNVQLLLTVVLSVVSLGKSSQSIITPVITSHYQCWSINFEFECPTTHLNGSQFRQVYSITHNTINHSQTQYENTHRMYSHQTWATWAKACLVISIHE